MPRSPHWPPGLPQHLELPQTSLYENLATSARRYPQRAATVYYGRELSYAALDAQATALAGHLQQRCGVRRGDRVALFMQNCPQFVVALYAILRADAVVVPVNSMNRLEEVRHIVRDSGARAALVAQELAPELLPRYLVPTEWIEVDHLPRTPSGKVDRRALPTPDLSASDAGGTGALESQEEELLAGIWSAVLGREGIGREDDFFELGGNSLVRRWAKRLALPVALPPQLRRRT